MKQEDLAQAAAALLGHRIRENNRGLYEDALRKVARALGVSEPEALDLARRRHPQAYPRLVAGIAIPETYFFRHPEHFALLEREARAAADRGRPLRTAWSAGCSTGEEAYSLALTLRRYSPDVRVVGTDASAASLASARRAHYPLWSFRNGHPDQVAGLAADGALWQPMAEVRRQVSFQELNFNQDALVPPAPLPAGVDVIFCRNVLMYLTPELAARTVEALARAVSDHGLLVLGALEGPVNPPPGFERLDEHAAAAFVRTKAKALRSRPLPVVPSSRLESAPRQSLERMRRLADVGDLQGALREAGALGDEPEALHLAAVIHSEQGDLVPAGLLWKRLSRLRPGSVSAHLQLALNAQQRGDPLTVEQARASLDALLTGRADEDEVELDGIKVSYVRMLMSGLGRAPGGTRRG